MTPPRTEYLSALVEARDALESSAERILDAAVLLHRAAGSPTVSDPQSSRTFDPNDPERSTDGNAQQLVEVIYSLLSIVASLDANEGPGQLGLEYRPYAASGSYWEQKQILDRVMPPLGI